MKICVNSMLCLMARPQIHLPNVKTCLDVVNTYVSAVHLPDLALIVLVLIPAVTRLADVPDVTDTQAALLVRASIVVNRQTAGRVLYRFEVCHVARGGPAGVPLCGLSLLFHPTANRSLFVIKIQIIIILDTVSHLFSNSYIVLIHVFGKLFSLNQDDFCIDSINVIIGFL